MADGDIFISFLARNASLVPPMSPGHVFFCIEMHLASGIKEDCFGFYPEDGANPLDGPGVITNEFNKPAIGVVEHSFRHRISSSGRRAIYALLPGYTDANYRLATINCIDFVSAIAGAAGLKLPPRTNITLPREVVSGLRSLYWNGGWQSEDVQTRFQLEIVAPNVDWTERNAAGQMLLVPAQFAPTDDQIKIERDNTLDVLAHIGFQPNVADQITAAGPRPSYLVLRRIDGRIEGEWSGLIATKDAAGNLEELKQPGTTPSKPFGFSRVH
ncbi:hypothetical protein EUU23_09425 [Sphingorhabdus sp. IMCC26285]|uniref:Uncharacterized protein n=1 Tax=Sphingorhabdus profundilacus TaxID=2509718 RepID=A0A6I4M0Z6_9SPHN|nr:hypothetical protein [Sphingorhabdus profundilacus]MVZ97926.1 hypothetical protein [Sphingorhabdus profundilacus]